MKFLPGKVIIYFSERECIDRPEIRACFTQYTKGATVEVGHCFWRDVEPSGAGKVYGFELTRITAVDTNYLYFSGGSVYKDYFHQRAYFVPDLNKLKELLGEKA